MVVDPFSTVLPAHVATAVCKMLDLGCRAIWPRLHLLTRSIPNLLCLVS